MWAFAETCRSLADGCRMLGLPVTGGNVSFCNATGDTAVLPTLVIGVMGVLDDVDRRTSIGSSEAGDSLVLLGDTRGGSAWAWVAHRHLGGNPPPIDLERERLLGRGPGRGLARRDAAGGTRPVRRGPRARARGVVPALRARCAGSAAGGGAALGAHRRRRHGRAGRCRRCPARPFEQLGGLGRQPPRRRGQSLPDPDRSAPSRSRLSWLIVSSGIPLGHTAVHSPMLVQPPKSSASCWPTIASTRA